MSIGNASFQCADHCGCMRSSFHNHKQLNSLVHAACAWLLGSIVQQQPQCIPLPKRNVRRMQDATRTWHFIITFHIRCPSHCAFVIAMYSRQSSMTCLLTQREHETRAAGGPLPNRQPSSTLTIGRHGDHPERAVYRLHTRLHVPPLFPQGARVLGIICV